MPAKRVAARLGALGIVVASSVTFVQPAYALTLTPLNTESFTGTATSSPTWSKPAGTNTTCLTAGTNTTQSPIPACSTTASDPAGQGTLRLTTNAGSQVGTVYSTVSLPTAQGLDIQFDTYQYNGTGADGIAFVLAATDPTNPAAPATSGPNGGSLGYSPTRSTSQSGVAYGYLGFGLDVFGNFSNSDFGGTDCPTSPAVPESITVRGAGSGTAGYCVLATTSVGAGGLDKASSKSRPASVPVEIALNPSGSATTTPSGLSVGAKGWTIKVGSYNGTKTLTGSLPSMSGIAPAAWLDPSTGLPYQLTFGWAASTGGSNEYHEINTLASKTVTGPLPVYALSMTDNAGGRLIAGNQATVSVTPSLDASQGSESKPATVTTTFPAGIAPKSGSFATNGYSCSTSGQVVTCLYTPSSSVAAGSSLPTASIPVTVGGSTTAGSYAVTSKVSSIDANPATASRSLTVSTLAASASGTIVYGATETLSISGIPAGATGSVTFGSGGTTLCAVADVTTATFCSTTPAHAGSYSVTATYTPGAGSPYAAQTTAATSFTVSKATPVITGSTTPATVAYGDSATLAVTGLASDATGSVTFRDAGGHVLCVATLPDRSCTTSAGLGVAGYDATATYSGDGNYDGVSASAVHLVVGKAVSTITASVPDDHVTYGSAQTLAFVGLPTTGATAATGTVTFRDGGGQVLCTATLPDASCTTSALLGAGHYAVTATYSGDANHATATSAATGFTVDRQASSGLAVGAAVGESTFGTGNTLSLTGLTLTGATAATGTVEFRDGDGALLCDVTLPDTSCTTSALLGAGHYDVTATYSGDDNHAGSTATTSFVVAKAPTAVVASSGLASIGYGTNDTLAFAGLTGASGTVTFRGGGQVLCTATLPDTSCTTSTELGAGHYDVTATYSGDADHLGSQATTSFDVAKAVTSSSVGATPTLTYGDGTSLTVGGLPTTGPSAATGTVAFVDSDGTVLCVATLPTTGCDFAARLGAGHHVVTATYSGDANHEPSVTTGELDIERGAFPLVATVSNPSAVAGQTETITVSGIPADATGTSTVTSNGDTICVIALPSTSCDVLTVDPSARSTRASRGTVSRGSLLPTTTLPTVPVGDYPLQASYSGDANYLPTVATARFVVVAAVAVADTSHGGEALSDSPTGDAASGSGGNTRSGSESATADALTPTAYGAHHAGSAWPLAGLSLLVAIGALLWFLLAARRRDDEEETA